MKSTILPRVLLTVGIGICAPALAGVGATSSGVTGTVGSTDPSPDVQSQSANFVQQNAANNGATGAVVGGTTTLPSGVPVAANSAGAAGATDASKGAAGNATGADAKSKPGDPANSAPAVPAAPPPPPPTYMSVVKHLKPDAPATTTVAVAPPAVAPATSTPASAAGATAPPNSTPAPAPAPHPPAPASHPTTPATVAASSAKPEPAAKRPASSAPVVTGGTGAAPDGLTFYVGSGIAAALCAMAFAAYVRSQQDDAARQRPPPRA
ncbi:MAG TPA: hypothetical protein VFB32_13940 [Rudaea sp.]|nr:hypothetical protein [Rudaea sp.]